MNEWPIRPAAATAAPTMPITAPTRKPVRRPARLIRREAGKVVSAAPITHMVTGRVAHCLTGASASPARPFKAMVVELLVNRSAWQADSSATLRLVSFTDGLRLGPGAKTRVGKTRVNTAEGCKPEPTDYVNMTWSAVQRHPAPTRGWRHDPVEILLAPVNPTTSAPRACRRLASDAQVGEPVDPAPRLASGRGRAGVGLRHDRGDGD